MTFKQYPIRVHPTHVRTRDSGVKISNRAFKNTPCAHRARSYLKSRVANGGMRAIKCQV